MIGDPNESGASLPGVPTSSVTRVDSFGRVIVKWTAITTAIVSAAVPLTEYIRGYANQRISEAERNSKLASDFLDKIAAKDASSPERLLYLGALASLNDHPLQAWAKEQRDALRTELDEEKAIIAKAMPAYEAANMAQTKVQILENKLKMAEYRAMHPDSKSDLDKSLAELDELHPKWAAAKTELAEQQGKIATTIAPVVTTDIQPSQQMAAMLMAMMMQASQKGSSPPSPPPPPSPETK